MRPHGAFVKLVRSQKQNAANSNTSPQKSSPKLSRYSCQGLYCRIACANERKQAARNKAFARATDRRSLADRCVFDARRPVPRVKRQPAVKMAGPREIRPLFTAYGSSRE